MPISNTSGRFHVAACESHRPSRESAWVTRVVTSVTLAYERRLSTMERCVGHEQVDYASRTVLATPVPWGNCVAVWSVQQHAPPVQWGGL